MPESSTDRSHGTKPRKAWLAALLSLLLPGLGQMYNGQLRKGVCFYLAAGGAGLFGVLGALKLPLILVAGLLLLQLLLKLWAIADAAISARRLGRNFLPALYNRPLAYLAVFLVFGVQAGALVSTAISQKVVRTCDVASQSMVPSLLPGDHLLIDMAAGDFARGDIVVFELPPAAGGEPRDFVKRIVGLPGDEIELRDKQLLVNGRPAEEPSIIHAEASVMPSSVGPRDNLGPAIVPEDAFFVLGDNRDRSYDSRFWGWVPRAKVHGKAVRIFWSWDARGRKVRWERLGLEVAPAAAPR